MTYSQNVGGSYSSYGQNGFQGQANDIAGTPPATPPRSSTHSDDRHSLREELYTPSSSATQPLFPDTKPLDGISPNSAHQPFYHRYRQPNRSRYAGNSNYNKKGRYGGDGVRR